MTNELDQLTAPPWRWKFAGNAGNYFLYGNDGKGPITHSNPDSADGRLKQAAPALLALLTERVPGLSLPNPEADFANDLQEIADIVEFGGFSTVAVALRAKAQAIRAAVADVVAQRGQARGESPGGIAKG